MQQSAGMKRCPPLQVLVMRRMWNLSVKDLALVDTLLRRQVGSISIGWKRVRWMEGNGENVLEEEDVIM